MAVAEEKEKRSVYLPPPWADRQGRYDGGQAGERVPQPCQGYSKPELIRGQRRGQVLFSGKGHTLPQSSPRTLPLSLRGLGLRARPGSCRQAGQGRGRWGVGGDESWVPLQAARCTENLGRSLKGQLGARQVELGGRPQSGQLPLQLAAISGPLAGGSGGVGVQAPVGVTQAQGQERGCARALQVCMRWQGRRMCGVADGAVCNLKFGCFPSPWGPASSSYSHRGPDITNGRTGWGPGAAGILSSQPPHFRSCWIWEHRRQAQRPLKLGLLGAPSPEIVLAAAPKPGNPMQCGGQKGVPPCLT